MVFSTGRQSISIKHGFTIREILVIIVIISVGLLSVLVVLTNGMNYVQRTRQKVVALNLAREGMEAVYQIRDTNRTRRAWVKDQCRLKINPLVDEWVVRCPDDTWIMSWSYALQRLFAGDQWYFALTGPWTGLDLWNGLDHDDLQFSLCQQSGYWDVCIGSDPSTSEGKYFREIQGLWLYLKDEATTWWTAIFCTWWLWPDSNCGNTRAKEFRFCSRVVYIGDGTWEVKLCGVITNFKGK